MPTQILSIVVPSSGPGPSVDVSAMVGPKTVQLTGTFRGAYVLYGSHDGVHFAPLFQFDAGGVEGFRRTFSGALASVLLVSLASGASGVTASISGVVTVLGGDNHFALLSVLAPGTRGTQPALDLGLTDYVSDLNFIAQGGLSGPVVVEGSLDGSRWNPLGEFSAGSSGASLLGPAPVEFGPLATDDVVRYVRLNVLGEVTSTLTVTVGGSKDSSGGAGTSETLAQAYLVGSAAVDQTLVITDANGGKVVFDATGAGFTGIEAVSILGRGFQSSRNREFGALTVGPNNLGIGIVGERTTILDPTSVGNVAIGPYTEINTGNNSVGLGQVVCNGSDSVAIGHAAFASQQSVALGLYANAEYSVGDVVVGANAQSSDTLSVGGTVVLGSGAQGDSSSVVLGLGARGATDAVVAGHSASADSSGSVVFGRGAAAPSGSDCSVVVGTGAAAEGSQSVVAGYGATSGVGLYNVVVGSLSVVGGVGAANTLVGFACYVGDPTGETRDFHNNVRVGGGNVMYSNFSVAVGGNTVVGDTSDASIIEYCIAVGEWATVVGSFGMAFGFNASADSREVVFGDNVSNEGYVAKFHVVGDVDVSVSGTFSSAADSVFSPGVTTTLTAVGSLPAGLLARQVINISGSAHYHGNWYVSHVDRVANKFDISTAFAGDDSGSWANDGHGDLFSFDEAQLTGVNTTVMTLAIKQSGGAVVNVPVTLSAPVGGVSTLQVSNS